MFANTDQFHGLHVLPTSSFGFLSARPPKTIGLCYTPSSIEDNETPCIVAVLVDAPYWVLGTDYDNYAVVWSCTNFGLFSTSE